MNMPLPIKMLSASTLICLSSLFICLPAIEGHCQGNGFEFGKVSFSDLNTSKFLQDTSAAAIVLNEFGEAYFDTEGTFELVFEYHVQIKILKEEGIKQGNIEIPLRKNDKKFDKIDFLKASVFNIENGSLVETKLERKNIFIQDPSKFYNLERFSLPNVKIGTIIEYRYVLITPFIYNLHPWQFQNDLPKIKSEYWAKIPGNYIYNISLKGPFELKKNENSIIKDCVFISDSGYGGKTGADCALFKFSMENIPAFVEEEYMLARSNFESIVEFELSEVRHFSGRVDKVTSEWKDANKELEEHKDFGIQLKRSREIVKPIMQYSFYENSDSLSYAKKIFESLKTKFLWNGKRGAFTELGLKKAIENSTGNIADLNLTFIACLRYAGFNANPVLLSTRENGLPRELFPILSDFNYVIARVVIKGKQYLVDISDDFLPFGMIPIDCMNGRGRVFTEKESFWIDLKASEKFKKVSIHNLEINSNGSINGTIENVYYGYYALTQRKKRNKQLDTSKYTSQLEAEEYLGSSITKYEDQNLLDTDKPYTEKFEIAIPSITQENATHLYLNPFSNTYRTTNYFKSEKRIYPLDLGAPIDETIIINFTLPKGFSVNSLPERALFSLPNEGGRYIFDAQSTDQKITITNKLILGRSIYSPEEYHYLREMYSRIVQRQSVDIGIQKN